MEERGLARPSGFSVFSHLKSLPELISATAVAGFVFCFNQEDCSLVTSVATSCFPSLLCL